MKPNSTELEICTKNDEETVCEDIEEVTVGEWFNLFIEQTCSPWSKCSIYLISKNSHGELQFRYLLPGNFATYNGVDLIIGNTYGQSDTVAASGEYVGSIRFMTYNQNENLSDRIPNFDASQNTDPINA